MKKIYKIQKKANQKKDKENMYTHKKDRNYSK